MTAESSATILAIDTKRMRLGMRDPAVNIVTEMTDRKNADLWRPEKAAKNQKIGPVELVGSLGDFGQLWDGSELDASARIIHMTYLVLNLIHTGA